MKKSTGFVKAYFSSLFVMGALSLGIAGLMHVHAAADEEVLRNASNSPMGYIRGDKVYNKNNKHIGYVKSGGVYNANNKKISNSSRMVGLLFCDEK